MTECKTKNKYRDWKGNCMHISGKHLKLFVLRNFHRGQKGRTGKREVADSPRRGNFSASEGEGAPGGETERGEQEWDNWQRVEAAFTTRQAAQLELKAPLRHNEDVAAN